MEKKKNLVIVESPAKSKTIEKYLGSDYKVVSSKGHIRDLSTKGKYGLGIDVENDFAVLVIVFIAFPVSYCGIVSHPLLFEYNTEM